MEFLLSILVLSTLYVKLHRIMMNELQYLCGLILLLIGFNIGYYESRKGLTVEDFKRTFRLVLRKFRR